MHFENTWIFSLSMFISKIYEISIFLTYLYSILSYYYFIKNGEKDIIVCIIDIIPNIVAIKVSINIDLLYLNCNFISLFNALNPL